MPSHIAPDAHRSYYHPLQTLAFSTGALQSSMAKLLFRLVFSFVTSPEVSPLDSTFTTIYQTLNHSSRFKASIALRSQPLSFTFPLFLMYVLRTCSAMQCYSCSPKVHLRLSVLARYTYPITSAYDRSTAVRSQLTFLLSLLCNAPLITSLMVPIFSQTL